MIADDVADISRRLRALEQAKEPPPAPIVTSPNPPEHIPDYPGQFDVPDPWGYVC